jgi:hypothetical protein
MPSAHAIETRNAYGYPIADDPEGLRADWHQDDHAGLHVIQQRVAEAIGDYHDLNDIAWIVEETLWQIRATLLHGYRVRIPLLGDLAICDDGTLRASGVPGLTRAPT